MRALLALLLSQSSATVDFRGHAPEAIERVLEAARPQLEACLVPPPAPPVPRKHGRAAPVVRQALPSRHLLRLELSGPGAVAGATVEGSSRLDAACARNVLLHLEFGMTTGGALDTAVLVPLSCAETRCAFPWAR